VIPEQDSKQVEEKQAEFKAQLQAQLSRMTPEQRARMEPGMLAQADGKPPAYTYEKKKTPARKISGFACQDYGLKRDGQAAGEACFATWKDMGISAEEFKATMLKAMPNTPGSPMSQGFEAAENAPGFPVWRTHVNGAGVVTAETTVKSLSRTALAAENFELPRGYTERSMADSTRPPK